MASVQEQFRSYLAKHNLKVTRQRQIILDAFLSSPSHLSAEELYIRLRKKHPNIGYATVYRTMKLLVESGIAAERHFGDRQTRYEANTGEDHHYHLICEQCGNIVEFEDLQIDWLLQKAASTHEYTLSRRRLEIYGLCPKCQKK
jgi:Fur family ferric uptake transcriptional regulator